MARKGSPTISQEELYAPSEEFVRPALDDTRGLDLDVEEESPFLRAQKRVSVRRSTIPKKAVTPLKWSFLVVVILVLASIAGAGLYHYGERSWRFRVESSDDIEITGTHNVTHAQVMEVLGGVGIIGALWYAIHEVHGGAARLTGPDFAQFIFFLFMMYAPIKKLSRVNATMQQTIAAAERIFEVIDTHTELTDAPGAVPGGETNSPYPIGRFFSVWSRSRCVRGSTWLRAR
jgi:ABC-type multidrug transport system fused ATPase/permease subunit